MNEMAKYEYLLGTCDWCYEKALAPHNKTIDALWTWLQGPNPGEYRYYYDMIYLPEFVTLQWRAVSRVMHEIRDQAVAPFRDQPVVYIELEFSGEEGSLALCEQHLEELVRGVRQCAASSAEAGLSPATMKS